MNNAYDSVVLTVSASLLNENEITRELIEERINEISSMFKHSLNKEQKKVLINELLARHQTKMSLGFSLVDSSEHIPWLEEQNENIDWYYWNRYKSFLSSSGWGCSVISSMDIVTDRILDMCNNPENAGSWQRKGLVIGNVQSGKTANYSGLVCKALDSGYKVIIILAGLLNSLRKQTQVRIDSGIVGIDSSLMLKDALANEKFIGVGRFNHAKMPVSITTINSDFNKSSATQRQTSFDQYSVPSVFVVKKNVSILRNLIDWIKNNNSDLSLQPMLLIDDEADHASINTKKEDIDPTQTNKMIRELLNIFPKNIYLGYTATPFANIFINPDSKNDVPDDLFPENFIQLLEPPDNYMGPNSIFIDDINIIREVTDYSDFLPLKHKKDDVPESLPKSILVAVRCFILVCAIRYLRGQKENHNSMMVNVSRFTGIQSAIRLLVHDYLTQLRETINTNGSLVPKEALQSSDILDLFNTWKEEFSELEFSWSDVQYVLRKVSNKISVIEVNCSRQAEKDIDYSERSHPNGRSLIAVGGLSLSRGLTLEGLSVTYFLRNSIMYDTLMQMGRWFGYRSGYEDLCRLYLLEGAKDWYEHITLATEELKDQVAEMNAKGKTPRDFGLCVRNHPDSLIVTARNKMRSSKTVIKEIDLTGQLIETTRLFSDVSIVDHNLQQTANLMRVLSDNYSSKKIGDSNHIFFEKIPYTHVSNYIELYKNHPESVLTDSNVVKNYIEDLSIDGKEIDKWNVIFVSVKNNNKYSKIVIKNEELKMLNPIIRTTTEKTKNINGIMFSQRKLGSGGFENIDLDKEEKRDTPLLIIYLVDCRLRDSDESVFPNGAVAYGISFPGKKYSGRIKKLATYQVGPVYWNERYGCEFENDDDIGSDL